MQLAYLNDIMQKPGQARKKKLQREVKWGIMNEDTLTGSLTNMKETF